jgi:hypothetical protein
MLSYIRKDYNRNPCQFHYLGHNYTGLGTNLLLNMEKNKKPINKVDETSFKHDIAYHNHKDIENRRKVDDKMINELENNKSADGILVKNAMKLKKFTGLGVADSVNLSSHMDSNDKVVTNTYTIEKTYKKDPELLEFIKKFKNFIEKERNKISISHLPAEKDYKVLTKENKEYLQYLSNKFNFKVLIQP